MIRVTNSTDSNHEASSHHNEDHSSFSNNLPNISEHGNPQSQSHHQQQNQNQNQQDGNSSDNNNDAKSVIFILEQIITLLKITLQTSSKLISPAITQMIQNILPIIHQYYQQAAPIRVQEWLQILTSALQSFFTIISETAEGRGVLEQCHDVSKTTMHLLTSANARQIIVEGVGMQVKGIEALRTPEMKAFLSSIPVFAIRVLDTLSSGEAKYLYHSFASLSCDVIELLGRDETTLALAEITAHLVHVLEQERERYGSWNYHRKQRRVVRKKVRHAKVASMQIQMRRRSRDHHHAAASLSNAANAKKRHLRNRFIAQTYADRTLLKDGDDNHGDGSASGVGMDGDRVVEDAILSSLGDNTRSDHAWLTSLGKNTNEEAMSMSIDEASLPSRVILPSVIPNLSVHEGGSFDVEEELKLDREDGAITDQGEEKVVDLTYLRNGIETRKGGATGTSGLTGTNQDRDQDEDEDQEQKDRHVQIQNMHRVESSNLHTSTRSVAGDSFAEDSFLSINDKNNERVGPGVAIEDLVMGGEEGLGHTYSTDTQKSPPKRSISQDGNDYQNRRRRQRNLMHEDSDDDSIPIAHEMETNNKSNTRGIDDGIRHAPDPAHVRGSYSSIAHFYRSLEDISSKIRDKSIANILAERQRKCESIRHGTDVAGAGTGTEMKMNTNIPGVSKASKWQPKAAAAAGAGNEKGQDVLLLQRKNSRRFRANFETDDDDDGTHTNTNAINDETRMGLLIGLIDILKSFVQAIPLKQKILFGSAIFALVVVAFIWFILGCYGLYFLTRQQLQGMPEMGEALGYVNANVNANANMPPLPNEIILRIVQDTNMNVDGDKIVNAAAGAIQKAIEEDIVVA